MNQIERQAPDWTGVERPDQEAREAVFIHESRYLEAHGYSYTQARMLARLHMQDGTGLQCPLAIAAYPLVRKVDQLEGTETGNY